MYIAPGQGQTLCRYVASFKMISSKPDFIHIFNDLYLYIAPGQGHTTPSGQTFDVNRKPLSLCQFVASLKKKSDFKHMCNDFIYVYSRGKGRQPLGDKLLMSTERPYHFAHLLQV